MSGKNIEAIKENLKLEPKTWLITGVAGFIGSHLLEELLLLGQTVKGVDNFATGFEKNLEAVKNIVVDESWERFTFTKGDICDEALMGEAMEGVDYVLHEAALGSVPRSIKFPLDSNRANIDGFLTVINAAKDAKVKRFVYASSSSVYGDSPTLPKVEDNIGKPLSPYALTKQVNELYAGVFASIYKLPVIGLRYFNVFGPRQNPEGAYAAVIPRWINEQASGKQSAIYGDGTTSRDFCFVKNVVEANLLAACVEDEEAINQVYNVALGGRTTLKELFAMIQKEVENTIAKKTAGAVFEDFRAGDVKHSHADISKAQRLLGYEGKYSLKEGLAQVVRSMILEMGQ